MTEQEQFKQQRMHVCSFIHNKNDCLDVMSQNSVASYGKLIYKNPHLNWYYF